METVINKQGLRETNVMTLSKGFSDNRKEIKSWFWGMGYQNQGAYFAVRNAGVMSAVDAGSRHRSQRY